MINEKQLDQLLADRQLGAGNFIYKIYENFQNDNKLLSLVEHHEKQAIDLSIKDIVNISDRLASAYVNIGVKPKDVVSLFFKDSFDYFLHFVALNSIGAIPSLVNGSLNPEVLSKFLAIIRPNFLMLNSKYIDEIQAIFGQNDNAPKMYGIEDLDQFSTGSRPPVFKHQDKDVIMIGHTSGTTGIPKGVIFTHESMFHGVRSQIKRQKGSSILSILPHSHGASISLLMLSLSRGAHVTILSQKDPAIISKVIHQVKPHVVIAFPKVYVDLCRNELNAEELSSVSYWIATGDANHESHIKKLIQQGHHIDSAGERVVGSFFIDNLGSSEFAFAIFRNVHSANTDHYNRCIGKPFPWVDVAVFDADGKALGPNQTGRLGVRAKSVTLGYWNNHSLTEVNKIDGYWLTGDLVFFDESQKFYHVDRTSDSIHVDGQEMYSCQIEEAILSEFDQVFDLSIVNFKTNQLAAYVELKPAVEISEFELLNEINHVMRKNAFKEISHLQFQSADKYTGVTGKKLKRELRSLSY